MEKVALITGGARGLGRTIAKTLAHDGFSVIINYNTSAELAKTLENELKNDGKECMIIKCDISNQHEVDKMIALIKKKYGKIDVLVNNSAITNDTLFCDKSMDSFAKVLKVNLIGTFYVSKVVGQIMYDNKFGKIINISSTNGINTYFPMCLEYDASKAGINSLTHNLAMQFAPYVMVNAVAPGFIATESEIKDMDEEFIEQEENKILLRRAGQEQDVANLISFLASDKSNYINSQIIKIDGGIYGD